MKFPVGIQLYLRKSDFDNFTEEELVRKIHETVVDSIELKDQAMQVQDTK